MYSSGDAAEQVVRMSLEGAEFALKITCLLYTSDAADE